VVSVGLISSRLHAPSFDLQSPRAAATKETPVKTSVKLPARKGNRGGGALKTDNPGNKGGGRLPSAIRETLSRFFR
jgi:hypothetical protein